MRIDAVNIVLAGDGQVLAYGNIVMAGFTIHDFKLIRTVSGRRFVSPPMKRLQDRCPRPNCGSKNHLLAKFCNECGGRLESKRAKRGEDGRLDLYASVAHPNDQGARLDLEAAFDAAYQLALYRTDEGTPS